MTLKLSEKSLDWALQHALNYGDTDIFPAAFEFAALEHRWPEVKLWLQSEDILKWSVSPARKCLVPKNRFGFREASQLNPVDFLIYTALVYDIGLLIERQRVPTTDNIVHSSRFQSAPDGQFFNSDYGYHTFQSQSAAQCSVVGTNYVVVADIADFYPRIYTHRIDNALDNSVGSSHMYATALKRLINQWAGAYSYGLPVGSAASRLIAELTIADVDELLLSESVRFVRYNDDFRIFCTTQTEAYRHLALLARSLRSNHGLTLQQSKTRIVTVERFRTQYLMEGKKREVATLSDRFRTLLTTIGIADPYGSVKLVELDEEAKWKIEQLNLAGILADQINADEPDLQLLKFLLRRLGQIGSDTARDSVTERLDALTPVIRDAMEYLLKLDLDDVIKRHELGARFIAAYQDESSITSCLEYTRMYLLSPFAESDNWAASSQYVNLYNAAHDEFTKRKLLLAIGRAKQQGWIRSRKEELSSLSPWMRRAYIYAASCLPPDEYKHWVRSVQTFLSAEEKAIAGWAQQHPIA